MTTVDKTFDILEHLANGGPRLALAQLHEMTAIPKPTLYRMLRTMVDHGLVRHDGSGRYSVGRSVFRLAGEVYRQVSVPAAARQVMVDLQTVAPETVHISAFRYGQLVYVEKLEALHPYQMASRVGKLQALHSSAIGKAVLAQLPAEQADALLADHRLEAFTSTTIVDRSQLAAALPEIRAQGYAMDDEEDEDGLRAIGVAFCDGADHPIGGISIVAPSFQMSVEQAHTYAPAVKEAAMRLEEILAESPPEP
ncbi:IclR family transcriptional regulator [Nocardia sp. NBC_01009]|uniref:IclR family transcriptional regulator n=1 Tax=Nocardia sp. NBC_01009 TaxID=2975996 RepID=UPI00386C078F|nr:IclR family transcriptional regulator [Nocardia sp. NBC_01009]